MVLDLTASNVGNRNSDNFLISVSSEIRKRHSDSSDRRSSKNRESEFCCFSDFGDRKTAVRNFWFLKFKKLVF